MKSFCIATLAVIVLSVGCLEISQPSIHPERDTAMLSEKILEAIDEFASDDNRRLVPDVVCAQCHPRQAEEYARSTMRYGFFSPTFNALEQSLNQLSDGKFSHEGEREAFCSDCHGPRAISEGLVVSQERTSRSALTPSQAREGGIGCDLCHSQRERRAPATGLVAESSSAKLTVNSDLAPNSFHQYQSAQEEAQVVPKLSSSDFCAPCHDVRPEGYDAVTKSDRLRSEDLFSEWKRSPWADADHPLNPLRGQFGISGVHDSDEVIARGEQISCQDCHMSLYPWRSFEDEVSYEEHFMGVDPLSLTRKAHKLYPIGRSATRGQLSDREGQEPISRVRRASTHYFTGVSQPLTPFLSHQIFDLSALNSEGEGEWVDQRQRTGAEWRSQWLAWREAEEGTDRYGSPRSISARRVALLKSALTLDLDEVPSQVSMQSDLRVDAWIENVGAGHNVPAGFSQERELWVSLVVSDQGRRCSDDVDCADLIEPPLFLDAPNRSCVPHNRQGEPDRVLLPRGSWELAARKERSAVCGEAGRCLLYRSGYLLDQDGDGRLNDEDLRNRLVEREIESFDERCVMPGPDHDTRARGIERGLVHFTNALQRVELDDQGEPVDHPSMVAIAPSAEPFDPFESALTPVFDQDPRLRRSIYPTQRARYERSRYRPAPPGKLGVSRRGLGLNAPTHLLANRAFNGQALAPFEPRLARYDIAIPEGARGPLKVEVKLRFRFFSPRTLFTLIARHPESLREEMIDEGLEIIDMASAERLIELRRQ